MNGNESIKSKYEEMIDFLEQLRLEEENHSQKIFSEWKELERNIKQRKILLEEHKNRRTPNISMFSPLDVDDVFDEYGKWQEEMEEWSGKLTLLNEEYLVRKEKTAKMQQLKNIFLQFLPKINNTDGTDSSLYDYSTKLLETQELERNRIASDLHDSTVQSLTTLIHQTDFCSKLLDIDPVRARLELESMKDMIRSIINDTREIIYDLRPMSISNIHLDEAIDTYCSRIKKYENLNISLKVFGEEPKLSSIFRITLFRIIQEALNNIVKHASAHKVDVIITYEETSIKLQIMDDGIGFDFEQFNNNPEEDDIHGFGLSIMKERASLLHGTFYILSQPDKGTKIEVIVPI